MHVVRAVRGRLRNHIYFSLMGRSLWSFQARLCPGLGARVRLLLVYGMLAAAAFSGRQCKPRRLRIRAAGRERDWWVADAMEVAALWTVFVAGEYGDWLPAQARVIVDAGANVGSATLWFRERFPDSRVIALEPNPLAFERLQRNLGEDPNIELVNAALAGEDGHAFFAIDPATSLQGTLQRNERPGVVEVETLTLDTVRERYAAGATIDLLKLNVEGAEWQILAGSLTGFQTIAIEIHEPAPGNGDPDAVLREIAEREGLGLRHGYSQTLAPRNLRWLVRAQDAQIAAGSGVSP